MSWQHLVTDALAVLPNWPVHSAPDQPALRNRCLAWVHEHHQAALIKGELGVHLTASILVLNQAGTAVLLTHHRKAHRWLQFGGHLEVSDTSLAQGARREGTEESGLELPGQITPNRLDAHALGGGFSCAEHLDLQYVTRIDQDAPVVSHESLDVAWFDVDALPDQVGDSVAEQIRVALAGR